MVESVVGCGDAQGKRLYCIALPIATIGSDDVRAWLACATTASWRTGLAESSAKTVYSSYRFHVKVAIIDTIHLVEPFTHAPLSHSFDRSCSVGSMA
jgi:hypothetical protein